MNQNTSDLQKKLSSLFRLFKKDLRISFGGTFMVFIILVAIFAPVVAPHSPYDTNLDNRLLEPLSENHLLGTDHYGRDILSRLIFGARVSLVVAISVVIFSITLGSIFGVVAGYYGGLTDKLIMRTMDVLLAFPGFLLALGLVAAFGSNIYTVIIAISLAYMPRKAVIIRSIALTIRDNLFVEAAKALGSTNIKIIWKHIIPNSIPNLIVVGTVFAATAIVAEAGLSFLGLGIQPPTPTWGSIISDGQEFTRRAPWVSAFAGLAIMGTVMAMNVFGDALRDVLDPKMIGAHGIKKASTGRLKKLIAPKAESMNQETLLRIDNLYVEYNVADGNNVKAVNGMSVYLDKGKTLGLVGEAGAGKTSSALSILRILPNPPGIITGGDIYFEGENIIDVSEKRMRVLRGSNMTMIFQNPLNTLNPVEKVGEQISEMVKLHQGCSRKEAWKKAEEMLEIVGISRDRASSYPHQLSGGMRQRVMIAMALSCNPKLLIADEPTTALDVTIQSQLLEILKTLKKSYHKNSLILITHDLGLVTEICDDVAVMYAGEIIEKGSLAQIFSAPKHPYTVGLFASIPRPDVEKSRLIPIRGLSSDPKNLPAGCAFSPRCLYADEKCKEEKPSFIEVQEGHFLSCWKEIPEEISRLAIAGEYTESVEKSLSEGSVISQGFRKIESEQIKDSYRTVVVESERVANLSTPMSEPLITVNNLKKYFTVKRNSKLHAVDGLSFVVDKKEVVGLVGESGCGKTTAGRAILRLVEPDSGDVLLNGHNILNYSYVKMLKVREQMQMIFQDPISSLDPRMDVSKIIAEPLKIHNPNISSKEIKVMVNEVLNKVGLTVDVGKLYPHELDGGRCQRVGIARALALGPSFIVCDEPVSALDVSVQAQMLNLLLELKAMNDLSYLFISHDLSVVRHISDRILVMYLGQIVESASAAEIFSNPLHPYSVALLSAVPVPSLGVNREKIILKGDVPQPIDPSIGCRFVKRCNQAIDICVKEDPITCEVLTGHKVSCHLYKK